MSDELDGYKERFENNQSLTMKAARDKEQLQTELDVVKDRWEKAHMIHQKLQVPILSPNSKDKFDKNNNI